MRLSRRLFVVLLSNGEHGKSTLVQALLSQARGITLKKAQKVACLLTSPWGREIDAYVFVRSYQETEKPNHKTVIEALDANDPSWRERELIIMPSWVSGKGGISLEDDTSKMIEAAHSAGFDAVCASLITGNDRKDYPKIWQQNWDERWTLPNPEAEDWKGQVNALGCDLWTWICRALAS